MAAMVVEPKRTFILKRGNKVNTFVLEDQNGDIIDTSSLESHKGKLLMVLKGKDHNPRQLFKVNCDEMPKLLRKYRIHVREEDMPTILLKKSLKEYATSLTKSSWRDSQNTVVSIYRPWFGHYEEFCTFVLQDQNGDIIDTLSLESHKGKLLMVLKEKDHNPLQLFKLNCEEMLPFLLDNRIHVREEDMSTILSPELREEFASVMTKSSWGGSQNEVVSMYEPWLGHYTNDGKTLFLRATSSDNASSSSSSCSSSDSSEKLLGEESSSSEDEEEEDSNNKSQMRKVIAACIDKIDRLEKANGILIKRVRELERFTETKSGKLANLLKAIEKNIQDYHDTKTDQPPKKKGTKKKKSSYYTVPAERGLDDWFHFDDIPIISDEESQDETDKDFCFESKYMNVSESIFWYPIKIDGHKFWLYRGGVYRKGKTWNSRCGSYGSGCIVTDEYRYYMEDGWEEKLFKEHRPQQAYEER